MALCDSCHRNPVILFCQNDNAKLCYACDLSLHSVCSFMSNHKRVWLCEVCTTAPAVVFCEVDQANMCTSCDELIHGSNILAALHVRQPIELSKRYLAREGQQPGSIPVNAVPDATAARPTAPQVQSNEVSSLTRRPASLANLVMVEGLNTFVAAKANKIEIEDYKRQCEEVMKLKPEMFQQAANSMQSMSLGGPSQVEQLPQVRQRDASQPLKLPMGLELPDIRSLSETKLVELQQGISSKDAWVPTNLNTLWKTPPTIESASAILREACNGLGEPDIVDQLLQGLGEQMQHASTTANTGEERAQGELRNKVSQDAHEDVQMGAESAGPSDTFVMPAMVLHVGNAQPLDREARVNRYREKRKNRKFQKTIRYASRAMYAGNRPRVKGRFAKREDLARMEGGVLDADDNGSGMEISTSSIKDLSGDKSDGETSSRLTHSVVLSTDL